MSEERTQELTAHLEQFSGSQVIYHHALVRFFTYTEGVRAFAQQAGGGAYWLLDILALEPEIRAHFRNDSFACVRLTVAAGIACLLVDDGNGKEVYRRADIHTDCPASPADGWRFFLALNQMGGRQVITAMLPKEY